MAKLKRLNPRLPHHCFNSVFRAGSEIPSPLAWIARLAAWQTQHPNRPPPSAPELRRRLPLAPLDQQAKLPSPSELRALHRALPDPRIQNDISWLGELYGQSLAEPGKRGARRRRGSWQTPTELARRLATLTITAPPSGGLGSLLDPALGAGRLLLAGAERLLELCHPTRDEYEDRDLRRRLLARHLFGVERDPAALSLARLVLRAWAGLALAPEPPPDGLRSGEALLGPALNQTKANPTETKTKKRARTSRAPKQAPINSPAPPLNWSQSFPNITAGFDLILANPPFSSRYGRESQADTLPSLPPEQLRQLQSLDGAQVLSGRVNDYQLFIIRAEQLRAPGGRAGFIIPDALLTNRSAWRLRAALTASGRLRSVERFDQELFQATVGAAIITWGEPQDPAPEVSLRAAPAPSAPPSIELRLSAQEILARPQSRWHPTTPLPSLNPELFIPLGELIEAKDGVNPGPRSARERILTELGSDDPSLRPCLRGADIRPHMTLNPTLSIRYDPSLLSPEDRRRGSSLRDPRIFSGPRLVSRQTADRPIVAVELQERVALNSVHNLKYRKPQPEESLFALAAWLNSAALASRYQAISGETRGRFPQVHLATLRELPVPRILLEAGPCRDRLAALARSLATGSTGLQHRNLPPLDEPTRATNKKALETICQAILDARAFDPSTSALQP